VQIFESLSIEVGVYVDEAGDHRTALEIDEVRVSWRRRPQRLVIADGLNAISPDGDGLLHRHPRIHGEELSVEA
jgi:hypothetical protein